jgi:UDP-4-amino-4,6-dideoxy-N-acetyl-beta-L-altrosamine N-acetyltransferase
MKKSITSRKVRIEDSRKILNKISLRVSATLKNTLSFKEVEIKDARILLKWRRKKRISKFQFTDIGSSYEKQKNWIKSSNQKKNYFHWIILFKKKPIGFFNVNNINKKNKTASWAWYIGSDKHISIGAFIPPYFYNWAFKFLEVKRFDIKVFTDNKSVIMIHKLHGYKSNNKKYFTVKNKKKNSYIEMFLLKKNWNFKKYQNFNINFPIKGQKKI